MLVVTEVNNFSAGGTERSIEEFSVLCFSKCMALFSKLGTVLIFFLLLLLVCQQA